jgi:hypothetical protein
MSVTEDEPTALESFRQAAYSMYAASLSDEDMERMERAGLIHEPPLAFEETMTILTEIEVANREGADLPEEGRVPRLFTLHALAGAVNRNPDLLVDDESRRRAIADAIVARVSDRSREDVEGGLATFAENARLHRRPLTPGRWQEFLEAVMETVVITKPGCNDDLQVPTPEGRATTIKSRFWTNATVDEMAFFIDANNWVASGAPFWREMKPLKKPTTTPDGYTATFRERVTLPLFGQVTVYLDIAFEQSDDYVHTTYQIAANPPHAREAVIFDSGWICATGKTIGPNSEPTLVEGLKSIQFANPVLNNLPDLSCDGGWVYLMINMALKGKELADRRGAKAPARPPQTKGPTGTGAPADPESAVVGTIGEVVDRWVVNASGSLQDHGEAVKTAMGRMLSPGYDLEWINDLIGTGKGAVDTTRHTVQAWRAILDALATLEKDQ